MPSEFNISSFVRPGKNTHRRVPVMERNDWKIRIMVVEWYLHDVYLLARPKVHIGDFFIKQIVPIIRMPY